MNFLQLCQRLRQEAGEAGTGPVSVLNQVGRMAQLVSWVQQAWIDIQAVHPSWGFLWAQGSFSTAASTTTYTPAADFKTFYVDKDGDRVYCNGTRLIYVPFEEARAHMLLTTTGKPTHYTLLPTKQFRPFPNPDGVYAITFDYHTRPVTLAADSDTPAIHSELHMAIVHRAKIDHAAFFEEMNTLAFSQQEYSRMLSAMEDTYLPQIEIGSPLV